MADRLAPTLSSLTVPIPDPTTLTTEQLRREIERLRTELIDRVEALQALDDERFRGVAATFAERQTQFDQLVRSNREMTSAAFASAKESVAKSDLDTDKRLEELRKSLLTGLETMDGKIADLKDRLAANTKWAIGAAIAVAGVLVSAAVLWTKPPAPLGPAYVAPPAYYQPQASPPPVAPQPVLPSRP